MQRIALIVGSSSDWETMKAAADVCESFGVPYESAVVSAHRTPESMVEFAKTARERGFSCIIAGAGGAAHLPGMVASLTDLPVLGVPMPSKALSGVDSLLSIVQMPAGVPTATFAIGRAGAENAALFAIRMFALTDPRLRAALADHSSKMKEMVRASHTKLVKPPGKAIGILGGGQLAMMLAESLDRLGTEVVALDSDSDAPFLRKRKGGLVGALSDPHAVERFFELARVACFDTENIPSEPLSKFAEKLRPSLRVLQVTQDRAQEKQFLAAHGHAPVRHLTILAGAPLALAVEGFGYPCIAKTTRNGYDGKGQHLLRGPHDVPKLDAKQTWLLEEVLQLTQEFSCIVARDGATAYCFPVFENVHTDHILDFTLVPARLDDKLRAQAEATALRIAEELDLVGLLTVEFFFGKGRDGQERLYVNELAPRTHNSGHVTRKACSLSQFDMQALVLTGAPLQAPKLNPGVFCMGQLLGEVWLRQGRQGEELDLSALREFPDVLEVYLYGKKEARPGRKMGHFIIRGDDRDKVLARAKAFREALSVSPSSPVQTRKAPGRWSSALPQQ